MAWLMGVSFEIYPMADSTNIICVCRELVRLLPFGIGFKLQGNFQIHCCKVTCVHLKSEQDHWELELKMMGE